MNTEQDLESMLWLARRESFRAGREAEREQIIKLLEKYENSECGFGVTHDLIALIKGKNK